MLRVLTSIAILLIPVPAVAQDALALAAQTYRGLNGDWAEPSKSCANPADTWSFGMASVRAGTQQLDLLGVGAGAQGITVDLISQTTGRRLPLALIPTRTGLAVRGSGIVADLQRCAAVAQVPAPLVPNAQESITTQTLDPDIPSSQELRDALAIARPEGQGTLPSLDSAFDTPGTAQPTEPLSADQTFQTAFTGAYSSGGACDWRIDTDRITADGTAYSVVNVSGDASRLGVQALRDDGTPVTLTLTPDGSGTRVQGGPDGPNLRLQRC